MQSIWNTTSDLERVKGIEPSQPAWKAGALPLSYTRTFGRPAFIKVLLSWTSLLFGGDERIRTTESKANGFTVRPIWPTLEHPQILYFALKKLVLLLLSSSDSLSLILKTSDALHLKHYKWLGADDRTWTYNLLITNQLLCQLSYISILDHYCNPNGDLDGIRTHDLRRDRAAF